MEVQQFISLWAASGASERANKDSYTGACRADVAEILESLTALDLAIGLDTPVGRRWKGTRAAA